MREQKICKALLCLTFLAAAALVFICTIIDISNSVTVAGDYIKWVDFNVSCNAMKQALKYDIDSYGTDNHIDWITLLAYAATKNGGNFDSKRNKTIDTLAHRLKNGERLEEIVSDSKYYPYYLEAYDAVLGGFVGEYATEVDDGLDKKLEQKYGLIAFLPIACGYSFNHFDDFGNNRSFGFRRTHLGNDLVASVGTPIVCVENGIVEEMGWNRFGGWRVGIRSLDGRRYYYYAHMRSNHPFNNNLSVGQLVYAGDVIGYVGMTGYSSKEGTNGMNVPHLHFGIQLIFDESQKECLSEIWINAYEIVELLRSNPSLVIKNDLTGEFEKKYKVYSIK